jgi:hypothetical protein
MWIRHDTEVNLAVGSIKLSAPTPGTSGAFGVSRAVDLGGGSEEIERSDILNNCE